MINQGNDDNECDSRIPGQETGGTAADTSVGSNDEPRPSAVSSDVLKDSTGSEKPSTFLTEIAPKAPSASNKITIVGTGAVGMACAFSILTQDVSSDIALIDVNANKVKGEMLDLQHGSAFMKSAKIVAGTDFVLSANSKVVVICAGARQKGGDTRLDLIHKNVEIFKTMIPGLVKNSPSAIFMIVSNPVDILTYIAWKLSGLPRNRIIGSGTNLDSSRFQFLLSQKMGIAVESVKGWIIGEHGDSSVPVWSGVTVGGVLFRELYPKAGTVDDPDNWSLVWKEVVVSAYNIIELKGFTCWAIGLSVADILLTILRNSNKVHAVSTCAKNLHGISEDSFLSLPCVLGENGISAVIQLNLQEDEIAKVQNSARIMAEHMARTEI